MKPLPRSLLITSTRPGSGSVGELFLASLCKLFQPGELYCVAGVSTAYEVPIPDEALSWIPMTVKQLPSEYHWQYQESWISKVARHYRHLELLEKSLEPLLADALKMIEENQIQLLWFVLNSPSMVLIAHKLLSVTGLPATAIVWDPINSVTEQGKMDKRSKYVLEARFKEIVSKLRSCGVASSGMQSYFSEMRPDLLTQVLINTPDCSPMPRKKDSSKLVITFAGSLYAQGEFLGLIAALNQIDWRLDDKPIELRVFSNSFYMPIHSGSKRTNLVFGGYLREEELASELASSDVAYLPYWFAKEYSDAVKRCFPAKLATYIANGCPVLFHGPKNSSPTSFLAKYKVGGCAHSSDPVVIEKALRYLVQDPEFINSYEAERTKALAEELGSEIFKDRFKELLTRAVETT